MKTLIVEDDLTNRLFLQECLSIYGECHTADNGRDAVQAFDRALQQGSPYELICLDIMMPGMDGQEVLKNIRSREVDRGILAGKGAKVIMTTALNDPKNAFTAFWELCDTYLVKPIDRTRLIGRIRELGLIKTDRSKKRKS